MGQISTICLSTTYNKRNAFTFSLSLSLSLSTAHKSLNLSHTHSESFFITETFFQSLFLSFPRQYILSISSLSYAHSLLLTDTYVFPMYLPTYTYLTASLSNNRCSFSPLFLPCKLIVSEAHLFVQLIT